MKKITLFLLICLSGSVFAQSGTREIALIPQPVSLEKQSGSYELPAQLTIYSSADPELKRLAKGLADRLIAVTGLSVTTSEASAAQSNGIQLSLNKNKSIPKEGYQLDVNSSRVLLEASEPAGIFYGIQTLMQLLPKEIESKTRVANAKWDIPAVKIGDHPRFGWRGLMLDVSRHFFTKEQVKSFIDDMVKYKFNLLHWHLTDDQGWRIEIKSLPKLTEVGAWRVERTGTFGTLSKPEPGEKATYGGFYTHEDIKEIVKYAADRFVDILPEIDVPGHSLAAIASYPELSCTPGDYYVSPGDRFMVWPGGGGHFYGLIDNTLCPANEKVYEFMDKVFTEVAQLFPFEYIHMGGDETARNFWEKSEQVKALMKREKLKNLDEVQSYFVKRMGKIIQSKGKKMIGWDEIMQGGLAPGAAVMSWRGDKGGIEAAKMGHEVVMSPNSHVYIDLMQGDGIIEPPVYSSIRLKKTFEFEPVPAGVDPKYIKGGQANLWTEQIYNMRHAQYMVWPRTFAVSEALWSPRREKNWNDFVKRVEHHFERFDVSETKYATSLYEPIFKVTKKGTNQVIIEMSTEVEGLDIHYSFDNSFPDKYYPKYEKPLEVPKDASNLKVITYRNGKPLGRMMVMTRAEMNKRAGIK